MSQGIYNFLRFRTSALLRTSALRLWQKPLQELPSFLEEPMELDQVTIGQLDRWGREVPGVVEYLPQFVHFPVQVAFAYGWVDNVREYQSFTSLVFAYRFPNHPYSKFVRALKPELTDALILEIVQQSDPLH